MEPGGATVAKLIYTSIASLDGYIADENGQFGWSAPDKQVHQFVNDLERPIGTYLLGRRMYDVLEVWERPETFALDADGKAEPVMMDYAAVWQAATKIVYSRTLDSVDTARTTIERTFDPAAVRELKASATADVSVGGAELAGQALLSGLVDECHLLVVPHLIGGGTRTWPTGLRVGLELLAEDRFDNGVVHLHYRVSN
jgi:dihydrofolate reductase